MEELRHKEQGNKSFSNADYKQAWHHYTMAIESASSSSSPNLYVHYSNRSLLYMKMGRLEEALVDASECTRIKPDWWKGYDRHCRALLALNRFNEALSVCDQGISHVQSGANLATLPPLRKLRQEILERKNEAENHESANEVVAGLKGLDQVKEFVDQVLKDLDNGNQVGKQALLLAALRHSDACSLTEIDQVLTSQDALSLIVDTFGDVEVQTDTCDLPVTDQIQVLFALMDMAGSSEEIATQLSTYYTKFNHKLVTLMMNCKTALSDERTLELVNRMLQVLLNIYHGQISHLFGTSSKFDAQTLVDIVIHLLRSGDLEKKLVASQVLFLCYDLLSEKTDSRFEDKLIAAGCLRILIQLSLDEISDDMAYPILHSIVYLSFTHSKQVIDSGALDCCMKWLDASYAQTPTLLYAIELVSSLVDTIDGQLMTKVGQDLSLQLLNVFSWVPDVQVRESAAKCLIRMASKSSDRSFLDDLFLYEVATQARLLVESGLEADFSKNEELATLIQTSCTLIMVLCGEDANNYEQVTEALPMVLQLIPKAEQTDMRLNLLALVHKYFTVLSPESLANCGSEIADFMPDFLEWAMQLPEDAPEQVKHNVDMAIKAIRNSFGEMINQ